MAPTMRSARTGGGSAVPVAVTSLTMVGGFAANADTGCALLADHTLRTWGSNFFYALGNGSTNTGDVYTPVTVTGVSNASAVTGGYAHFCALLGVPAVICGHMALKQMNESPLPITGRGMALTGLILGYLWIGLTLLAISAVVFGVFNSMH